VPAVAAVEAVSPAPSPNGTAVLLVDDDADVRAVAAELLGTAGFAVSAVASASAALLLIEGGYAPSVLVVDIIMPEMNGTELAAQARALRPGLPVLFTSGYADPASLGLSVADDPVLHKPFSGADLVAHVQDLVRPPARPPDNVVRLVTNRAG
jgi:CheY-like chemotaxis protein